MIGLLAPSFSERIRLLFLFLRVLCHKIVGIAFPLGGTYIVTGCQLFQTDTRDRYSLTEV